MATVIAVFLIGAAVTLVIAKGMMQANDFAKTELKKLEKSSQIEDLE